MEAPSSIVLIRRIYYEKILEYPKTKVIAFDRDSDSKNIAIKIKKI